ncbi:hypothetical protein Rs2_30690 [Raphanus sativus]|nr:hypothetical protein Rs2_30690 [Raphanus sativus]
MPGLQTTLVSSIEDLFDTFGVMGPIQPTSLLAKFSKKGDNNPDFVDNESYITGEKHDQQLSTLIDKIKNIVIISSRSHPRLASLPDSLSAVQLAVSKAIEIVVPHLVKMSVDIAVYSTKAHILMTYPLGADDNLRNNAASVMATSLAQRYAKKLCKEPLRGWIYSLLHGSIQHLPISYKARSQIVDSIITNNLQAIYVGIQEMARTEVERDIHAQVQLWIRAGNDNNSNEVIKEKMKAGISVNEMKDLLDFYFVFVGDKYEALLEAIFSGVEKGFAKVLEEKKIYLTAVMEPTSQCFLLQAIENYFYKGASVAFKKELPMVFEYLLTAPDLADGEDVTYFVTKIQHDTEASTSIRQSVKNLLSRIQDAAVQDRAPYVV